VQETLIAQGISPDKAKTLSQGLAEVTSAGMGAAVGGTQGAITGMAVDTNNRQLHQDESQALAQLKKGKSAREQHQLDAAACALAKCAEGVSANDPNYATLQALQQEGTQYTNAQKTLTSTGLFVYTNKDGVNDFLTKNGEIGTRLGGGLRMAGGAAGTVGGSAMAVVGVGTCPSVAGCALIPVGAGLAALSYSDLIGGSNQLTGPYNSTEGQRVLDSFSPSTYPGERDPSADLGIGGVTALVELGIGKYGFKLLDKMTVGDTVTPLPTKSGGVGKVSNSAQQENSPSGKYANRLDVQYRTAEDVNSDSLARLGVSGRPPYQTGTRVTEYVTKEADQFVRVTSGENAEGAWMMRKEAIQGLSPEEIARKYSLPATPKYISDVNVPAGTGIRTGKVESNFGGNQGAIQYELISRIPRESFTNTRPLR
jgi:filamentous hemagglutinin